MRQMRNPTCIDQGDFMIQNNRMNHIQRLWHMKNRETEPFVCLLKAVWERKITDHAGHE